MTDLPRSPLDAVMTEKGLRNDWLAEQLGCDPSDVSRWRSGARTPTESRRAQINAVLDTSVWPDVAGLAA